MPRDDAASPLVATMSLVLSAVALAAVVFVVARGLDGGKAGHVPPVGFVENEDAGTASVPIGQKEADWSRVLLTSDKPVRFALNGAAGPGSALLPPGLAVPASQASRTVHGGDVLDFCGDGLPQASVHIQVAYVEGGAGQVFKDLEFTLLAPCL